MIQLLKEWKSQKWGFHCPLCKPERQIWRTLVRSVTSQLKRTLRHQWTEPLWWRGGNESSVRGAQPPDSSPESLCTTLLLLVSQSLSCSGDCSINKFCIYLGKSFEDQANCVSLLVMWLSVCPSYLLTYSILHAAGSWNWWSTWVFDHISLAWGDPIFSKARSFMVWGHIKYWCLISAVEIGWASAS